MLLRRATAVACAEGKGGFSMKSEGDGKIKRPKKHDNLTLRDVNSSERYMSKLLDTLETKTNVLPKVDEKGNSECPFAEGLYAQKEQAVEKVTEELGRLRRLLELLKEELARLRANLAQVQTDAGSLHLESAKEKYLSAKQGLEYNIQKNQERQKEILELISQAEEMLRLARTKKWPLGKPEERMRFPAISSGPERGFRSGVPSSAPASSGPSLRTEVDSLFSLGPLGGVQPLVTAK